MDKECRKLSLGEWVKKHIKRAWCKLTPLNLNQHHDQLIETLEELQDAITRKESGTAARRTTQLAAKVGAGTATSSVMMGLAGLFGSASTGTAIGTLSGAAFTSSALAWIGGTVATGGAIVSGAGIAVGVGSFFGAKWAWQKYLSGKPREDSDLTEEESVIQLSIDSILIGLRKFPENDRESYAYHALWLHALTPIIDKLESLYDIRYSSWPALAKRRIRIGLKKLKKLRNKAQGRLATEMSVPVSTFSVVVMQLMSGYSEFSSDQLLVLDAFRRSTPKLAGASPDEIADYLRSYSDESLPGVLANVKGIYHELYYVELENSDGDDWGAEIMGSVSHEAVDVRLTNLRTGEVKDVQLKTNSRDIYTHQKKYDADVYAPDDVAVKNDSVTGTGITNQEINEDLRSTVDDLTAESRVASVAEESLGAGLTAAFVTMAISIGGAVRSGEISVDKVAEAARRSSTSLKMAGSFALLTELIT